MTSFYLKLFLFLPDILAAIDVSSSSHRNFILSWLLTKKYNWKKTFGIFQSLHPVPSLNYSEYALDASQCRIIYEFRRF